MIVELLAALSASAAVGMRVAVPLLLIGLLQGEQLWSEVPLLSALYPPMVLGVLVSWTLVELLLSKDQVGVRLVQMVQLVMSPVVGAIAGITVAKLANLDPHLLGIIGVISGLLSLVLQMVQVGWFYRLRGLPLWAIFGQDILCVALLLMAFDAPEHGGIMALFLLWFALRSAVSWQRWHRVTPSQVHRLPWSDRPIASDQGDGSSSEYDPHPPAQR